VCRTLDNGLSTRDSVHAVTFVKHRNKLLTDMMWHVAVVGHGVQVIDVDVPRER
jgi:hypothetical protein